MNETAVTTQKPNALTARAKEIDRIASEAMALFEGAGSFEAELGVAQSVRDLRAALTPEIMAPIMSLMNSDLGFLTDSDPNKPSKNNQHPTPYPVEVVRDCVIEAKLRGFHVIGNEFNIIARRFYAARNGLKRRCETWPGVTDLKIVIGVPKIQGDQATVNIYGQWKKDGVKDEIVAPGGKPLDVLIRVNNFMGPDAIVGKAERKLYKRIFDRLSGRVTPDGDVDDVEALKSAKPANEPPSPPPPPPPPKASAPPAPVVPERHSPTLVEEPISPDEKAEAEAGLAPALNKAPVTVPTGAAPAETPQKQLERVVVGAGFTFNQFLAWGQETQGAGNNATGPLAWDTYATFDEIPTRAAAFFVRAQNGMLQGMKGGLL